MAKTVKLDDVLSAAIATATTVLAENPRIEGITPHNKEVVRAVVQDAVANDNRVQEVAAAVAQATTPIVWYKSEVTVGNLVGLVCLIVGLIGGYTVDEGLQNRIVQLVLVGGPLVGQVVALIGRLRSKAQPVALSSPT